MNQNQNQEAECCPPVDTERWQHKTHVWENKPFIKGAMPLFFHMPFPWKITRLIMGLWGKAEAAGAVPDMKDFILLACDPSPWKGEYYLAVTKEVPDAENVALSGTYISKVFDGPFNAVPKYIKEMNAYLKEQGKAAQTYYFYYTTCPKCAKKYGHNYIIAFAQVG